MRSYELGINSIKKELENAIDFYTDDDNNLTLEQFCNLLKSISGESNTNSESFPILFWKLLNPSLQSKVNADLVHDFLLIIFGTFSFAADSASNFFYNYLKKYGLFGDDLARSSSLLIKQSRSYFADRIAFRPIGHHKESALTEINTERTKNFTFKPEINPCKNGLKDSWEDRYKTSLQRGQRLEELQEAARLVKERKEYEERFPYELKISAKKWNLEKEKELTERLSKKKDPHFKINIDEVKSKEIEPCTHIPKLCAKPTYLKKNVALPKEYNETVERIKKKWTEGMQKKIEEEKHREETDERLKRLRAQKFNPPSQLSREKKERKVAVNMEITVYPGK